MAYIDGKEITFSANITEQVTEAEKLYCNFVRIDIAGNVTGVIRDYSGNYEFNLNYITLTLLGEVYSKTPLTAADITPQFFNRHGYVMTITTCTVYEPNGTPFENPTMGAYSIIPEGFSLKVRCNPHANGHNIAEIICNYTGSNFKGSIFNTAKECT